MELYNAKAFLRLLQGGCQVVTSQRKLLGAQTQACGKFLRDRLKKLIQCAIHGFGLLKGRQMTTLRNNLKLGVTNQAVRSLGYSDWQQPIILSVQDQRWDGDLG
jgi:hypothetical protein